MEIRKRRDTLCSMQRLSAVHCVYTVQCTLMMRDSICQIEPLLNHCSAIPKGSEIVSSRGFNRFVYAIPIMKSISTHIFQNAPQGFFRAASMIFSYMRIDIVK